MNAHLSFVLSDAYGTGLMLAPDHLGDLRLSGLSDTTILLHKFRSVPVSMFDPLLGFIPKDVHSAYLIPFPDPLGGWFDYVKLKTFSGDTTKDVRGDTVTEERRENWKYNGGARKYLVRKRTAPRLYFPIPTMGRALDGDEPLWLVEGMKKSLAVAQLDLPAVGIESAWSWHAKDAGALLDDFACIRLQGRVVEVCPDSDVSTNPSIARAMRRLADALRAVGARPRLVKIPARATEKVGIDDFIVSVTAESA